MVSKDIDIKSLYDLQNTAIVNGYTLNDLVSFKMTSDKGHYVAIQIHMDKTMLGNVKDLIKKVGKDKVTLPVEIDVESTNFDNFNLIIETDSKKRINYSSIKVENLTVNAIEELDEETSFASSTIINNTNLDLTFEMNYKNDVAKRIPNSKELEQYTEYNLADIGSLFGE